MQVSGLNFGPRRFIPGGRAFFLAVAALLALVLLGHCAHESK